MEEFCKGRINFEGSNTISAYSKRSFIAGNSAEDVEKNEKNASEVCGDLFAGPRPALGWWDVFDKEDRELHIDKRIRHWRPRAIISITGGAKGAEDTMREEDMAKIINTIVKAAKEMKALIVDGGSCSGVMKEIGKAVKHDGNHIAILGVFPWNAISDQGKAAIEGKKVYRVGPANSGDTTADLDSNHQYFALIEEINESESLSQEQRLNWRQEIRARYFIEKCLSYEPKNKSDERFVSGASWKSDKLPHKPHVLIIVNGGVGTIDTAHMFSTGRFDAANAQVDVDGAGSAKLKRVPIVVVANSGRAANVIAEVARMAGATKEDVIKLLRDHMQEMNEDQHDEYAVKVMRICQGVDAVTVYKVEDDHSLAYAMMKAICRGTTHIQIGQSLPDPARVFSSQDQLKLLMQWNAQEGLELMRIEFMGKDDFEGEDLLEESLKYALKHNLAHYVDHFLSFEAKISDSTLIQLYGESFNEISHASEDIEPKKQARLLISSLLYFQDLTIASAKQRVPTSLHYLKRTSGFIDGIRYFKRFAAITCSSCKVEPRNGHFVASASSVQVEDINTSDPDCSSRPCKQNTGLVTGGPSSEDMFLWSVVSGRAELAWFFWFKGNRGGKQHCIARALLACAIERACGRLTARQQQKLLTWGKPRKSHVGIGSRFETAATRILDLCYKKDPVLAVSIITIPWIHPKDWFLVNKCEGDQLLSPLLLAFDAKAQTFIDHPAFQTCLDRIWYGRIKNDQIYMQRNDESSHTRVIERPDGFRIEHFGLLGWIQWCRPLRGLMMDLNLLDFIMELNLLLSCVTIIPVLWSKVEHPGVSNQSTKQKSEASNQSTKQISGLLEFFLSGTVSCILKLVGFYFSPCALFYLDFASYLSFLIIYTIVGFQLDHSYTTLEGVMHFWIFGLYIRELREIMKGARYLVFGNNYFDLIMLIIYLPAMALRIHESAVLSKIEFLQMGSMSNTTLLDGSRAKYSQVGGEWGKARSWHGIAGIFFWVRIVDYFRAARTLGPLMLVLSKVSSDALQFFMVLLVFIISFGAAIVCAGRPRQDPNVAISTYFTEAIFVPFFEIFGEHFLDGYNLAFNDFPMCSEKNPDSDCSENQSLGIILLSIYLFISSIILMNLLIAMMNSSYDEVLQASTSTWRFQRLELVLEFSRKQIVPFNIPMLCIRWIAAILAICPSLDSLHQFLNDQRVNSDLNRLLKAFPDSLPKDGLNYGDMYSDDGKMAALFNDIHGERSWISWFERQKDVDSQIVTQKADFIRDCAELVMAMCDKLVDSQKQTDTYAAELRPLEADGWHLSTTGLEIRGLKKQLSSEINSVKGEICRMMEEKLSTRANEAQRALEEIRVEKEKLEQTLRAECRKHEESMATLVGELAAARKRLRPLPINGRSNISGQEVQS